MALTAIQIKKAGDGKLFDTDGLFLRKSGQTGKWVYRYTHLSRRREMGLGSWPDLSLADARKRRDHWKAVLNDGRDPITERDRQQEAERVELNKLDPTFAEMVDLVFDSIRATLRGDGKRGRWRSPLDLYMIPAMGRMRGSAIQPSDIRDALAPIWRTKHPTARKALERTRRVFRLCRKMRYPVHEDTIDSAEVMLGAHKHVTVSHPALPWQDMPEFWGKLNLRRTSDQCLAWTILHGVRDDASRGMEVAEIDFDSAIWTVPEDRVKGHEGRVSDFRVPLSPLALEMAQTWHEAGMLWAFPGKRGDSPITNTALGKRLREMGYQITIHGFRSTFKDWVEDNDICSWRVSETILGHTVKTDTEGAYARSDLLDRRRPVMESWANYVTGASAQNIIKIRG